MRVPFPVVHALGPVHGALVCRLCGVVDGLRPISRALVGRLGGAVKAAGRRVVFGCQRTAESRVLRMPAVYLGIGCVIAAESVLVLCLERSRASVLVVLG